MRITARKGTEAGFTLVEVMVAMLVLLIGLLGVAKLQIENVQNSRSALYRMHATVIAEEMLDRVRSNPAGLSGGAYSGVSFDSGAATPASVNCDITDGCAFGQIATRDKYEWARHFVPGHDEFQLSIPAAEGLATIDAIDAGNRCGTRIKYDVTVSWDATDGREQVELTSCLAI